MGVASDPGNLNEDLTLARGAVAVSHPDVKTRNTFLMRLILTAALVAAGAWGAAQAQFALESELVVNPAAGVALAALVAWGARLWPGVWLGAFIACPWQEVAILKERLNDVE